METKPFLLSVTLCGIKNIEKPITIDFYKNKGLRNFNSLNDKVRVIYGPNGSGKTAIMTAMFIAKQVLCNTNSMLGYDQTFFDNTINLKLKQFDIVMEFATLSRENEDDNAKVENICRYEFTIAQHLSSYSIIHEKFSQCKGSNRNGNFETVFETQTGQLLSLKGVSDQMFTRLKEQSANTILKTSFFVFLSLFNQSLIDNNEPALKVDDSIGYLSHFSKLLNVSLEFEDIHFECLSSFMDNQAETCLPKPSDNKFKYEYVVRKDDYHNFEHFVASQAKFIQIFKPKLKQILIDRLEDKDVFRCHEILDYGTYQIDSNFESTGIKKLMDLYIKLRACSKGSIIFIDEMDANISGVYLQRLVEYFNQFGEGQLCFTTHALDPMYPLCDKSKSIYFLGENNEVTPWVKNGHYKPFILYPTGMIPGIEFSLDVTDFIKVFA